MASTKGYKRISVNLKDFENFVSGLKNDENLMLDINTQLAIRCRPYVPFKTGTLSNANVTRTGVSYNAPYAHYQYTGIVYGPNYFRGYDENGEPKFRTPPGTVKYPTGKPLSYNTSYHPYAGPEWDKRMMLAEGASFIADCQELVNKKVQVFNKVHALNW